ncbi:MAG: hypothetical protein JEZ00_00330 [Anaerolineaceae bacterium]|nr:hypothetical protein [Anaerolineaceae bacterium]
MTIHEIYTIMAVSLFLMGIIAVGAGVFILISRSVGEDIREITQQTAKLAQKGITDEIAGLVGNASALIDALNNLIRTTTGIGIFLIMIGIMLLLGAYYMIRQIL